MSVHRAILCTEPARSSPAGAPGPGRRAEASGRTFLPLWFAAVGFPLLVFFGGAWWSWHGVAAETRLRLVRTVDMLQAQMLRAIETQDALLTAIQLRTRDMEWEEIAASRDLARFLRDLLPEAGWIIALGIAAPDGRLVQLTVGDFPPPPVSLADRDYVRAHRGLDATPARRFLGEPVAARLASQVIVPLSRARLDAAGRPDGGVIWASFHPEHFESFFASILEARGDTVAVLRGDGSVLARVPRTERPPGRQEPDAMPSMRAARAAAASGSVGFAAGASAFEPNVSRLYAARHLAPYDVSIVYGLDVGKPRAAWLREVGMLAAATGIAMLLLILLTCFAALQARREAEALDMARQEAERRLEAEARMRHAERIGALGRVAAGVAHDMNNLVQSVQSAARLLRRRATDTAEVTHLADLLAEAAARGARIADRMLGFSRPVPVTGAPAPDLGDCLTGLQELLAGLLGAGVRLRLSVARGLPPVRVDRGEFETVLINLVVNARDAMPGGGEVTITAAAAEQQGMLRVAVRDTGEGMPPEVLAHASEPFFTTKPVGRGTGLGLAMARQFAERAGGAFRIESAPGAGTTVTLLLPAG